MNISCVYKIYSRINKKTYIGSTKNFEQRKKVHLTDLRLNKHHNHKIQKDYNKFGENNFEFIIIELTNDLLLREQYYIDNTKKLYNITKSAEFSSKELYYKNIIEPAQNKEELNLTHDQEIKILLTERRLATRRFKITPKQYCELQMKYGIYPLKFKKAKKIIQENNE